MARRKLSLAEQLKGVRAALRSPRTPSQLREGLRKRAEELRRKLNAAPKRTAKSGKRPGLLDQLRALTQ